MTKILFETKTCGRCGGSGHHSYCTMYGNTCFGCSGSGKVYTTAGKAAKGRFEAKRMELFGVEVGKLEPGMRFIPRGESKWRTVVSVGTSASSWSSNGRSGHYTEVTTKKSAYNFCEPTEKVVVTTPELWPTMVEYAKTLNGAKVVAEEAAAA